MVKENLMPKTETVYEINNEIQSVVRDQVPSYEEFMKTYESDGSLNYDDLGGGGLGEVEGYGPCYRRCGYANPKCECYMPEKCVALYLSCPAPEYKNGRAFCLNKTPGPFYHGGSCGDGRSYIDINLYIRCMKPSCGATVHIRNVEFACSSHKSDFSKASKEAFGNALTVLNNT
jgi:hypothetical protein